MRILLTGASSFTGFHFARILNSSGVEVLASLTKPRISEYEGLYQKRLRLLENKVQYVFATEFGSDGFVSFLEESSIDCLFHHGAFVGNYKGADFPIEEAFFRNTRNAEKVFEVLKRKSIRFIYSSTYAEKLEGGQSSNISISPYGFSKYISSERFRYCSDFFGLKSLQIVIPNPFGCYEEERLTFTILKKWLSGETPTLSYPKYIRDNIPVDLLASIVAKSIVDGTKGRIAPSGYVGTMEDFVNNLANRFEMHFGNKPKFDIRELAYTEPMIRTNDQGKEIANWNLEEDFWHNYFENYKLQFCRRSGG